MAYINGRNILFSVDFVSNGNEEAAKQEGMLEFAKIIFKQGKQHITIPDGVTELRDGAFCYSDLTGVTIPDSVTRLHNTIFSGCEYLEEITIPNGIKTSGVQLFNNCKSLTKATTNLEKVKENVFGGCTNLHTVTLGNVTEIHTKAFRACSGLVALILGDGSNIYYDINLQDCLSLSVASMGNLLFKLYNFTGTGEEYTRTLKISAVAWQRLMDDTASWWGVLDDAKWNVETV